MYDFGRGIQCALFWGKGQTLALKDDIFSENVGQNFSVSYLGEDIYLQLGALRIMVISAWTPGIHTVFYCSFVLAACDRGRLQQCPRQCLVKPCSARCHGVGRDSQQQGSDIACLGSGSS